VESLDVVIKYYLSQVEIILVMALLWILVIIFSKFPFDGKSG